VNPSTLRFQIDIYRRTETQNPSGYMAVENEKLFSGVRADFTDASTREVWEAHAAKARNIVNWKIRGWKDIKVGHWVFFEEQWYEILAVQRIKKAPREMILKTTLKESRG